MTQVGLAQAHETSARRVVRHVAPLQIAGHQPPRLRPPGARHRTQRMPHPRRSNEAPAWATRDHAPPNRTPCICPATWPGLTLTHQSGPVGRDDRASRQSRICLCGLPSVPVVTAPSRILVRSTSLQSTGPESARRPSSHISKKEADRSMGPKFPDHRSDRRAGRSRFDATEGR